jgi:uncharacterized protein YcsI (UPF0317 family)
MLVVVKAFFINLVLLGSIHSLNLGFPLPFSPSQKHFLSRRPFKSSIARITSSNMSDNPQQMDAEKMARMEVLRAALPACQPQEGSPANTFTSTELLELQSALATHLNIDTKSGPLENAQSDSSTWMFQSQDQDSIFTPPSFGQPQEEQPQEEEDHSWFGAPQIASNLITQEFRQRVRSGEFVSPTNAVCPGFLQCNVVILPQGPVAFDFLLFCQRNPKSCPLIEVCDVGSPFPNGVAKGADLRTDIPKYAIYRDGKLEKEVTDVTDIWPENSVAFLIGCSFSYDGALLDAKIPLRSAEAGKNVPMFRTNLPCRSAGSLRGNMVVSMKPIKAMSVAKEIEITNAYPHAHGGPVCVGNPKAIGIANMDDPDWGDAIEIRDDEVPVFHACGVTPQSVLIESKVPFAITHSAGHMFVTDLPADMKF